MRKVLSLITALTISASFTARGDTTSELAELFNSSFYQHYTPRKCGQNILDFIGRAESRYKSADSLVLLKIVTSDETIQAERSRTAKRDDGTYGDDPMYFHVIALDKSGNVYDFDYTDAPQIVSINEYLENMFLNDDECLTPKRRWKPGDSCIGRNNRLIKYYVTVMRGEDTLSNDRPPAREFNLRELLANWRQATEWSAP